MHMSVDIFSFRGAENRLKVINLAEHFVLSSVVNITGSILLFHNKIFQVRLQNNNCKNWTIF
jgi:hypothetical protein